MTVGSVAPEPGRHENPEPDAGVAEREVPSGPAGTSSGEGKPMLLDFTRDYCLPCELMRPWIEKLRTTYGDRVEIAEINIDRLENKDIGLFFKVSAIPTQVYVDRNGRVAGRNPGMATYEAMEAALVRYGLVERRSP